jgi:hypothetical protein
MTERVRLASREAIADTRFVGKHCRNWGTATAVRQTCDTAALCVEAVELLGQAKAAERPWVEWMAAVDALLARIEG